MANYNSAMSWWKGWPRFKRQSFGLTGLILRENS